MASLDLVLELVDKTKRGLDSAGRNIDKAEGKTGKLKKAGLAAGAAVGGIALAGVGIAANLIGDVVDASKQIDNLSASSGLSVENLQALGLVAKTSGGDMEDVADASRELGLRLTEMEELGSGPAVDALNLIGLSLEDLEGLTADEKLLKIGGAIGDLEDPALQAFAAEELLGGSSERLNDLWSVGTEELKANTEAAKASGKVMSEDMVAGNVKAGEALDSALGSVKGVIAALVSGLAPILEIIATLLNTIVVPALQFFTGLLQPLIDLLVDGLTWALENVLLPAWQALMEWAEGTFMPFFEGLKPIFEEVWARVQEIFQAVVDFFTSTWETFSGPFKTTFMALWDGLKVAFETLWDLVKGYFQALWDGMKLIWDIFSAAFTGDWEGVWNGIKDFFEGIWNGIKGFIETLMGTIFGIFETFGSNLGGVWDNIKEKIEDVWDGIVGAIKGAVNEIIGFVNTIIGAWNGLGFKVPEVSLPSVKVLGKTVFDGVKFGGQSFSFPKLPTIPRLAEGGIVTSPTLALIGEAGPEAVVPLNRSRGAPQALTVILNLDGVELGQAIVSNVNEASRRGELLLQGSFTS